MKATYNVKMPVFKGTYGNYWGDYRPFDENGDELPCERYDINHANLLESIGKSIVDYLRLSTDLFELTGIESMTYSSYWSPRFYNFENDEIYVDITINTSVLSNYIYDHQDIFRQEIYNHHTSRDGFISMQSNKIDEWADETKMFTDFEDNEYYLGFLLQIAAEIEDIDETGAYLDWWESANEECFCTIHPLTWDTVDLNQIFLDNLNEIDFTFGDIIFVKEEADKRAELFSTDWVDEIEKEDKIEILEGIGLSPG